VGEAIFFSRNPLLTGGSCARFSGCFAIHSWGDDALGKTTAPIHHDRHQNPGNKFPHLPVNNPKLAPRNPTPKELTTLFPQVTYAHQYSHSRQKNPKV
jgi:hypothetical protein